MIPEQIDISGVEIVPEGVSISYMRVPRDVRKNGLLWQHNVVVPTGSDYDDEIETFMDALQALLVDVLEDEETAEPIEPTTDEDEDEDDD